MTESLGDMENNVVVLGDGRKLPVDVATRLARHQVVDTPLSGCYMDLPTEAAGLSTPFSLRASLEGLVKDLWDQVYDAACLENGDMRVEDEDLNRQYVLALANLARVNGDMEKAVRLTELFRVI